MILQVFQSIANISLIKHHFLQITTFITAITSIFLYFFVEKCNILLEGNIQKNPPKILTHYQKFAIHKKSIKNLKRFFPPLFAALSVAFVMCLLSPSLFKFLKYLEIITIITIVAFVFHRRVGKRRLVFVVAILQSIFFAVLTSAFISSRLNYLSQADFSTIDTFYHLLEKSIFNLQNSSINFYNVTIFFLPLIFLVAVCGFTPFNNFISRLFKKLSPAEKILFIGTILNFAQFSIIKIYSQTDTIKYFALFYLCINSLKLVFARKVDEIIFNLITFVMCIFLLLISINSLSTNYASLLMFAVFMFCFALIICYEWLYYDTGFSGKPLVIASNVVKLSLYNKYAFKGLLLMLLSLQIISTPISISFFPFIFLQLTFSSMLLSYLLIFAIFCLLGFSLVRLLYPFYICVKYATKILPIKKTLRAKTPLESMFLKTNNILIVVILFLLISAFFINFSYIFIYTEFHMLDSLLYTFFATTLGFTIYNSKFYVFTLRFSKNFNRKKLLYAKYFQGRAKNLFHSFNNKTNQLFEALCLMAQQNYKKCEAYFNIKK